MNLDMISLKTRGIGIDNVASPASRLYLYIETLASMHTQPP